MDHRLCLIFDYNGKLVGEKANDATLPRNKTAVYAMRKSEVRDCIDLNENQHGL